MAHRMCTGQSHSYVLVLQVERLGFGLGIPTERLTPPSPDFVHDQIQKLLSDPAYKVESDATAIRCQP